MDYNLFQKKTVGKKGKIVKKWYYWYIDHGVQKQKVCKDCATKAEAVAFINSLPPLRKGAKSVREVAENMFLPGSEHVKRRAAFGRSIVEETLRDARIYIDSIIETWGDYDIRDIDVQSVGNYLISVERSNSWKKRYISIFGEIFDEAIWNGMKIIRPSFPRFTKKQKKADIFSSEELKKLFVQENFSGRRADSETLYLFFLCCVFAGLRLGEARALRPKQFLLQESALVIDGFCKADGTRTTFNKKGSETDTKTRIVLLPENFTRQISDYIARQEKNPDDFLFTYSNSPLRREYLEDIFESALKKAGIQTFGRKLTPHSLRYTYVTKMRRTLPIDTVRKLVGHTDEKMTEYYTQISLENDLAAISCTKNAVESLFD